MKTPTGESLDLYRDHLVGLPRREATKRVVEDADAVYYFGYNQVPGFWWAIGFSGKRVKYDFYYHFTEEKYMLENIDRWIAACRSRVNQRKEKAAKRKSFQTTLQVGDVLHGSWGYDQTNAEFWEIIWQKGNRVRVRRLTYHRVSDSEVMPNLGVYAKDPPETKIVQLGNLVSFPLYVLSLWDGQPKYETPFGFGH